MGRTCNIPRGHTEKARFQRKDMMVLPEGEGVIALQISFFAGYEAGKVTHYIGVMYTDAKGSLSFCAKACNGRNKALWYDANLAECRESEDFEEVRLSDLNTKAGWMKAS